MHLANKLFLLICTLFVTFPSIQSTNAKTLSEFVTQMSYLTRLTNGIVLEAGLLDGTIPSDVIIAEMLRTGGVSLDELLKIDASKLVSLISTMESIQSNLSSSSEIIAVEERFSLLETIRKSTSTLENLTNLPGKDEYIHAITQIDSKKITIGELNKLFQKVNQIQKSIQSVNTLSVNDTDTKDGPKTMKSIRNVITSLGQLENDVKSFKAFLAEIQKLRAFGTVDTSFLKPLLEEAEKRNKFSNLAPGPKIQLSLINDNIQKIQEASKVFKDLDLLLNPFLDFVIARNRRQWSGKYLSGFANGFTDIQSLPTDAEDDYLKLLFNETNHDWISQHLSNALILMADFGKNVSDFDSTWQFLSNQSSLDALTYIADTQVEIGRLADDKDVQLAKLDDFEKCDQILNISSLPVQDVGRIKRLQQAKVKLDQMVTGLNSFEYLGNLSDFSTMQAWKKNKTIDEKELNTLKSLSIWNETNDLISNLNKDFGEFKKKLPSIITLIPEVSHSHIETYLKSLLDSNYSDFYLCLNKTIGDDGRHGLDILKKIKEVRGHGVDPKIKEASDVLNEFLNSTTGLKTLRQSGMDMNLMSEIDVIALRDSKLKDGSKTIEQLIDSLGGLELVQKLAEIRNQLDPFLGNISFVSVATEKEKSKLEDREYQELLQLQNMKNSLNETLMKIKNLEEIIQNLEPTNFNSLIPILKAAGEVPDVEGNVRLMEKSLESLGKADPTIQNNITVILSSLKLLEDLSMDFSTYKIASGSDSLKDLDLFFTQFGTKIPPSPTEPPTSTETPQTTPNIEPTSFASTNTATRNQNQVGMAMKQVANTTASSMPEWQIGVIVAVCLIVAAAVILGVLSFFRGWFCFKKPKPTTSLSDNDPIIILPPLPPVHAAESLYIPPPSVYQPLPMPPPPPPTIGQPKAEVVATPPVVVPAQPGPQDFPQATITVEATQENEVKTKTVDESGDVKPKEGSKSKESGSKGTQSTSKEDMKMKPSQEVM